jgi:hypothetical protein
MSNTLEEEFHLAMLSIDATAGKYGYHPSYFLRMVHELGGVKAAKLLLSKNDPQSGLARLWQLGLLENSMEALVLQERWKELFSDDERQAARKRLQDCGYAFER